jgi:transcriptional regulator with XRE-family HTH domain
MQDEFEEENDKCFWVAVGKRIRQARLLSELERKDLEQMYGISHNAMNSWENAKKKISPISVVKLCKAFREERWVVTPEWIYTGKGEKPRFIEYQTFVDSK